MYLVVWCILEFEYSRLQYVVLNSFRIYLSSFTSSFILITHLSTGSASTTGRSTVPL